MTRDEALEVMAKERAVTVEELKKFICSDPGGVMCDNSNCHELRARMAQLASPPKKEIELTPFEIQSNYNRVQWAEGLIRQLPETHEGRNSWLLNYGVPGAPSPKRVLVMPTDAASRNEYPMFDGLIGYFPNALAEVARLSFIGNEQHNKGEPMHWAIGKSTDHANKIVKHLVDHGHMDTDGTRHSTKLGWRALALLEDELVAAGAPRGRNAY